MQRKECLRVEGMMCQRNCGTTVQNILLKVKGVVTAEVSFPLCSAIIEGSFQSTKDLIDAVESVGFEANLMENLEPDYRLGVEGMHCQSCEKTVRNALLQVPNVAWAKAIFGTSNTSVWGDGIVLDDVIAAIQSVGFEAKLKVAKISKAPSSSLSKNPSSAPSSSSKPVVVAAVVDEDGQPPDTVLAVRGMFDAAKCPLLVRATLGAVDGVLAVQVSFDQKVAYIWGFADSESLVLSLSEKGYSACDFSLSEGHCGNSENTIGNNLYGSLGRGREGKGGTGKGTGPRQVELRVGGMSCASCVRAVETGLAKAAGVQSVRVALLAEKVQVVFEPAAISAEAVATLVRGLGYSAAVLHEVSLGEVPKRELLYAVTGMARGASSAQELEGAVMRRPGVFEATASSETGRMLVRLDENVKGAVGPRDVLEMVQGMGFGCSLLADGAVGGRGSLGVGVGVAGVGVGGGGEGDDSNAWSCLLVVALVFGLPVMALHLAMTMSPQAMMLLDAPLTLLGVCSGGVTAGQAAMLLLNLPLQFVVGYRFYRGAFIGAMHGRCVCVFVWCVCVCVFYTCFTNMIFI